MACSAGVDIGETILALCLLVLVVVEVDRLLQVATAECLNLESGIAASIVFQPNQET